jgi:hypothetical protein
VSIAYLGTLMVGCYVLGVWTGRRLPDHVEAGAWRRVGRKLRRLRAS